MTGRMSVVLALSVCVASWSVVQAGDQRIQFPTGYATSFSNYLSLDRVQNPDQIIRRTDPSWLVRSTLLARTPMAMSSPAPLDAVSATRWSQSR